MITAVFHSLPNTATAVLSSFLFFFINFFVVSGIPAHNSKTICSVVNIQTADTTTPRRTSEDPFLFFLLLKVGRPLLSPTTRSELIIISCFYVKAKKQKKRVLKVQENVTCKEKNYEVFMENVIDLGGSTILEWAELNV